MAETVRRGLARGYRPALFVQLGSLIGDATWAILALSGAAFLVHNVTVRLFLGLFGAAMLLWLAKSAFYDGWRGSLPKPGLASTKGDFVTGMLLSLSNPFAIAFWLGAGSSTVTGIVAEPQFIHFLLFLLAFMAGAVGYSFFMAGLVTRGQKWLQGGLFRWVSLACGFFLCGFAFQLLWKLGQSLLELG